jgi:hypothetical protein
MNVGARQDRDFWPTLEHWTARHLGREDLVGIHSASGRILPSARLDHISNFFADVSSSFVASFDHAL